MDSAILAPDDYSRTLDLQSLFPRHAPLEVDVGCGKGRFLTARAKRFPDRNFLGIDRLLARLRRLDRKARREALDNVRLLRLEAAYSLAYLLPDECAAAVHVFFPDPWPKRRHHRRRLFNEDFLSVLYRVLLADGRVNVATDHADYFSEIRQLFSADPRFSETAPFLPEPDERTEFEIIFSAKGEPIFRGSFRKRMPEPTASKSTPTERSASA